MALTESSMLALGTTAPSFLLPEPLTGNIRHLNDYKPKHGTVIMFICNHCPYVIHIQDKLIEIAKEYQEKGIQFIAISSNDVETHPDDSPDKMKALAEEKNFSFPYLYDESQETAKAYHAECTPDFFVFDQELKCVYRGRFDNSSPGKTDVEVTGEDLLQALDALIAGQPISEDQKPSMGCNIKWK